MAVNKMVCPECDNYACAGEGLLRCKTCGLGKTSGPVAPPDEQDYMDEKELVKRQDYFQYLFRRYVMPLNLTGRCLDVGCGNGMFVDVLKEHGVDAYGLDSFRGVDVDESLYINSTLYDYECEERYEFVSLVHAFEHMDDPKKAIRCIERLLTREGKCLIVVPNFGGIWSRQTGMEWPMLNTEHHYFHYTPESIRTIFESAGLRVLRLHTYSGYFSPSSLQTWLAQKDFYDAGWGSIQPFRSLIFRSMTLIQPVVNYIHDIRGMGGEIQLLLEKGNL